MARAYPKFAAAIVALALVTTSTGAAAATAQSTVSPLVALSAFGSPASRAALCSTGISAAASAAATAQAPARPGCVLPVVDAPPPVVEAPPPPGVAVVPAARPNILPLLLGLAAITAAVVLLLRTKDRNFVDVSPG